MASNWLGTGFDALGQGGNGLGGLPWGNILGAGAMGLGALSQSNPANAAMPYLNQIQGQISPYYQPYINAGQGAINSLTPQYNQLINNPGEKLNQIGSQFQQSPGFKFQVGQATGAANNAAAAGGLLGSPSEQVGLASTVNNLANQDYYNWLNNSMGLYGQGLQGLQGLSQQGLQASSGLADNIMSALQSQAQLAYAGQANQNQQQGGFWSGLGSLAGAAAKWL